MTPYPWQQAVLAEFWRRLAADTVPHALLVCGQADIGKRGLADCLAALLQCSQPRSGIACGECRSCTLNAAGSHPDRYRLEPAEAGKAIRIDEVRGMVEFVSRTSQIAARKVVLIEPAEAMNRHAANSLLKSLEEPPGATHLLLVCAQPSRLPATVRSRCQAVNLPLPDRELCVSWLAAQGIADAAALLQRAGGRPLAALRMVEDAEQELAWQQLPEDLHALCARSMPLADFVRRYQRDATPALLERMNQLLVDLLRFRATGATDGLRRPAAVEVWQETCRQCSPMALHRLFEEQLAATRLLDSGANPNPQLLFEDLLLRWRAAVSSTGAIDPCRIDSLSF